MNSKLKLSLLTTAHALFLFFYIFEYVWTYSQIISFGPLNILRTIGLMIMICLSISDLIYKKFDLKTLIKSAIFIIISIVVSANSKNYDFLILFLYTFTLKDINIDKFIFGDLIIRTVLVALEFFLFSQQGWPSLWQVEKIALGFGHANIAASMLMIIGIEYLYLSRNKCNFLPYLLNIVFIAFNFYVCKSRASLVVSCLAIIVFLFMKLLKGRLNSSLIQFIVRNSFVLFIILSFFLVGLYSKQTPLGNQLNELFSTRLSLADNYLNYYGINLFGQEITVAGNPIWFEDFFAYTVDLSFIYILLLYGVVGCLLFAYLYNRTFNQLFKRKDHYLVILLLLLFVYGLMETGAFRVPYNPFLVVLTIGLFEPYTEKEKQFYLNKYIVVTCGVLMISLFFFRDAIISNASQFYILDNFNTYNQSKMLISFNQRILNFNFNTFDWSLGLGASIYNEIANGLYSVFNLLVLPLKTSWIPYFTLYLNIIKLIVLGIGSTLWLSKFNSNRYNVISLSVIVVFSSFILNNYADFIFDYCCLLPFVLYSIESAIQDKKYILIFVSTIILLLSCPTLIIETFLILLVYLIYRLINIKDIISTLKIVVVIVLSLGIVSFISVPCLKYTLTEVESDSFFSLLISLTTPLSLVSNTSKVLYTSVFGILILTCAFGINKNKTISSVVVIVLSLVCCLIFKSASIFYYSLILFSTVLILDSIEEYKDSNFIYCLIAFIVFAVEFIFMYFSYASKNGAFTYKELYISILLLVLISITIIMLKFQKLQFLTFTFIMEACISMLCFTVLNSSVLSTIQIDTTITNMIKENDNGFYRVIDGDAANKNVDKQDTDYNLKFNLLDNAKQTPGITINNDLYNHEQKDYINLISKKDDSNYLGSDKNYLSAYNISGAKYWTSSDQKWDSFPPSYFENMVDNSEANFINFNIYKTSVGWCGGASNGQTLGTAKDGLPLEAFTIDLNNAPFNGDIIYQSYLRYDINWQDGNDETNWKHAGEVSGATDVGYQICGIRIKLTGELAKKFNIFYRVSDPVNGWTKWAKNGEKVGCYNDTYIEKVQIEVRSKENLSPWQKYYKNKYYIELGYVNNNLINEDYLLTLNDFEKEKVLRNYVATNDNNNTSYEVIDGFKYVSGYSEGTPFTHYFEEPVGNDKTIVIVNGGIPVIHADLYYQGQLVKSESFYQYDYCNINLDNNQLVDSIVVSYYDIDETGYDILLAIKNSDSKIEEHLYNQRINNSFRDVEFKNDYISANISISENNSFVYTYVPYDDNWKVFDNGNEVSKVKANLGFIGFRLNQGEHNIEFVYGEETTVFNVLSLICLVLAACFIAIDFVLRKKKLNDK